MSDETARRAKIRHLNDQLRTKGIGGQVFTTIGITALKDEEILEITNAIRNFSDFNKDNDPYEEHDCAVVMAAGRSIIWKIDYFNSDMTCGSIDPTNTGVTRRVMTIMLACEY